MSLHCLFAILCNNVGAPQLLNPHAFSCSLEMQKRRNKGSGIESGVRASFVCIHRNFKLTLLSHLLVLFHLSLHTRDFLKDWCILQQIWEGNEPNATPSKVHARQLAHLSVPCCTKNIRQCHVHGIFRAQQQPAVYFSIFHLTNLREQVMKTTVQSRLGRIAQKD